MILLGDANVGKTKISLRIVEDTFDDDSAGTIGMEYRVLNDNENHVKYQIWDTAGQERFRSMLPSYFRNCAVVLLVYDVSC